MTQRTLYCLVGRPIHLKVELVALAYADRRVGCASRRLGPGGEHKLSAW